jgi:hypothetical protein
MDLFTYEPGLNLLLKKTHQFVGFSSLRFITKAAVGNGLRP